MAAWPEIENGISDAIDGVWAETFEFRPMASASVNSRSAADSARSIKSVSAIWSGPTKTLPDLGASDSPTGFVDRAKMTLTDPSISIDVREFNAGEEAVKGDHFARADGSVYVVKDVQPDGQGRVVMPVAKVS